MEKSKENGYVPGVGAVHSLTSEQLSAIDRMSFSNLIKYVFYEFRFLTGLGLFG